MKPGSLSSTGSIASLFVAALIAIHSILFEIEKEPSRSLVLYVRITIFTARATILCRKETCRWHVLGKEKPPHYCGGWVFALPIFTASRPATIVGVHVLNFCVRDGNRWTHMTINTNSARKRSSPSYIKHTLADFCYSPLMYACLLGDPYRIRTDVNGVRGRCLNHLTNGPLVRSQGLEPGTH